MCRVSTGRSGTLGNFIVLAFVVPFYERASDDRTSDDLKLQPHELQPHPSIADVSNFAL
jgi:hypothetical protein